jgi:uncharacterized cupin superfamily protein
MSRELPDFCGCGQGDSERLLIRFERSNGERSPGPAGAWSFPYGPTGAHKVMTRSESPARMLMLSSARTPGVSVYPDSDKIGVWPGDEADGLIFERGTRVPWSHGEEGWERAL